MNKGILISAGQALYGERWQTDLARDLGLSDARRIRQWLSGDRPIPALEYELMGLLVDRQSLVSIAIAGLPLQFGSSLQHCCDYLNSLDAEALDQIDTSSIPTFGGPDVEDTNEVYSWNETHVLTRDNNWIIEPRCRECGEAIFHCEHDH